MIKQSEITLSFEFVNCDGMKLWIGDDEIVPNENNRAVVKRTISWPGKMHLRLAGKEKFHSQLDKNDTLVSDGYVKLLWVKVDNLIPDINFLKRWPKVKVGSMNSNEIYFTNYFGFNGYIELDFAAQDSFQWLLRSNQYRDDSWNKNQ